MNISGRHLVAACLMSAGLLTTYGSEAQLRQYSEERQPCRHYEPNKQALFGDLHVHTSLSFDAYVSSVRQRPDDAYRYAKGESISVPGADGTSSLKAQISRPLDFTAVTDHSEFLGQINVCTEDATTAGYWWPHCVMSRAKNLWVQLLAANWWTRLGGQLDHGHEESFACQLGDCDSGEISYWGEIQRAAEHHYDRSDACEFTTFVGYEYTDAIEQKNMHRNVIFRNANVPNRPISTYDTGPGKYTLLWQMLDSECLQGTEGCDVMSIPHNANLSGGLMFPNPGSDQERRDRLRFEPVVEITQHKGSSECRFDRLAGRGLFTEDELCDFEQVPADNLKMMGTVNGIVRTEAANMVPLEKFGRRNMMRNVLKDGLVLEQQQGENPFKMGFIGSTDTHTATPGATEESPYKGHIGRRDSEFRNVQDHFFANPGGHAVVWAEENSRDAIFDAIRRKETYATSGTRPLVRFFAGDYPDNLCQSNDALDTAYANGVPMGGNLTSNNPTFFVVAQKDIGTEYLDGTDLQRIQIIKGWVDADGISHEKIYDVAGNANNGADVDPQSCAPRGQGFTELCQVWRDPDPSAGASSFYYARVIENPTCRWSTLQCKAAGVDPFSSSCQTQAAAANQVAVDTLGAEGNVYDKCCLDASNEAFYSPVIQERAWTSPIWVKSTGEAR
ncbi:MAG: hypothetical protein RL336_1988 [Pseudomonadota bacterium]